MAREYRAARMNLEQFLKKSAYYNASILMGRVLETDLYREKAILYGRVGGWVGVCV